MAKTQLVLFDLDGTLADTAPDLANAANLQRERHGLPPMPLAELRPYTSAGARGMLGKAFGLTPDDARFTALREEWFSLYEANLCVETRLFAGMNELLIELEQRKLPWGIVTNKSKRFTNKLIDRLGLLDRCAAIVSGDTTPHSKPHPAPLFFACETVGIPAINSVYVGDDLRDVEAGKAAGMMTVAAAYGYCGDSTPQSWQADHLIEHPLELLDLI